MTSLPTPHCLCPPLAAPILAGLLATALIGSGPAQGNVRTSDIVIRGGSIYDGSSNKSFVGDVAVSGDRIVYVGPSGRNPFKGKRVVDARGMIVAPGFIDPHTHAETFLTGKDATTRLNLPWMMQGVTTIFTGVDGRGPPGAKPMSAAYSRASSATSSA